MDMDPKGQDDTNNANNGVQDGASISDGVQGMQLAHPFGEINIGSLKVPLSPTGNHLSTQHLGQNVLLPSNLSPVQNRLKDKACTDFHVDSLPGLSTSGLPQVFLGSALHGGKDSAHCQPGEQQLRATSVRVMSADGTRESEPMV
jgi:hypothetical protein